MEKDAFKVPQKAAIEEDGKFLVMKRSPQDDIAPGCWGLPGGKLRHMESWKDGLKREVKEETGLEIGVAGPDFVFNEESKPGRFAVIIVYKCKRLKGEIRLNKEHTEFKWAAREEILELDLEKHVRAYFERRQ